MLCSASSIATQGRKKVRHETPDHWASCRRSLCRRSDPGRGLPSSRATCSVSTASPKALLHPLSCHSGAQPVLWPHPVEPAVLQPESPVEAELVPARFWLRHRNARTRRGGRGAARRAERRGQDQPHHLQRRFYAPARRICIRRPLGRTFTRKPGQSTGGLNDLQLHPDQPISHLPAPLSASVSRWLEGEGHPCCDALRSRLRTSLGRPFPP